MQKFLVLIFRYLIATSFSEVDAQGFLKIYYTFGVSSWISKKQRGH